MSERFWIWSNEHGAWWPQNRRGYVRTLDEAGDFSVEEANAIVADANFGQEGTSWFKRNEVAIPVVVPPT